MTTPQFLIVELETGIVTSSDNEDMVQNLIDNGDHTVIDLTGFDKPSYYNQDNAEFCNIESADDEENNDDTATASTTTEGSAGVTETDPQ